MKTFINIKKRSAELYSPCADISANLTRLYSETPTGLTINFLYHAI